MKARSFTPPITPSPFEDFHEQLNIIACSMEETPTRAVQKFLKVLCLRRDDFRCLATGIPEKSAVKAGLVPLDPLRYACDTELTHIIPFAIGHGEDRDQVCQNLLVQSYKC